MYIDGNHEELPVLSDLKDAYRVVKPQGYITGDDYHWTNDTKHHCVKMAVKSFVTEFALAAPQIHNTAGGQFVIVNNKRRSIPDLD